MSLEKQIIEVYFKKIEVNLVALDQEVSEIKKLNFSLFCKSVKCNRYRLSSRLTENFDMLKENVAKIEYLMTNEHKPK